jgi:Uma2 family endonuclease
MTVIRLRKRITIHSFGTATMRKRKKTKGNEPDGCFYVQSAPLIGNRVDIDFEVDPPPDIAVEIDLHRDSISKFSIYAALGVGEVWRYDGDALKIDLLAGQQYVSASQSRALPMLTCDILTSFLKRMREDESQALVEFDEWVMNQPT